jgi:hypothetical protein
MGRVGRSFQLAGQSYRILMRQRVPADMWRDVFLMIFFSARFHLDASRVRSEETPINDTAGSAARSTTRSGT